MADDEQKQLDDAKKLPIIERVKHANWKVRSAAFEDIRDKCDKVFDEDDPVLDEYGQFTSRSFLPCTGVHGPVLNGPTCCSGPVQ